MTGAYSGLRILDFTQGIAGPMAAALLADHDAETIKVEPPGGDRLKGDPSYFAFNRGKRIVTLDLDAPVDAKRAKALIASADVVLFDRMQGDLKLLGLDAETLTAAHPALVYAWTPHYGVTERWSDLPEDHLLLSALTGIAARQSSYRGQPVHLVAPLAYYGQALNAAAAIGAALYEREQSGKGQTVTCSGLHGAAQMGGGVSGPVRYARAGRAPLGNSVSYRNYQCADGKWLFLGTLFAHFFMRALDAMELDEAAVFGRPPTEVMEARFREKTRDEWIEIMVAHDVPAGPVRTREDWFASDTVADNALRVDFQHPTLGRIAVPSTPVMLGATPGRARGLPTDIDLGALPSHTPGPTRRAGGAERGGRPATTPPLHGVKVLDLGTVIAGAYGTAILASYGADVIKVEPAEGDPWRSSGLGFGAHNRGKRALCLDLKHPQGRELFLELVRECDVVLDNFRGGTRAKLGIDYETLKAINPRIISCTITAYGASGPRATLPGFDPLLQAEGGLMAGQGEAGGEPILHTMPACDVGTAIVSAFGVVAALNARERTGQGQEIITSLAATSVTLQTGEIVAYEGRLAPCPGACDCLGSSAVRRLYPCADGWIAIACTSAEHTRALLNVLGQATLTKKYAKTALAQDREGALAKSLTALCATRGVMDLVEALRAVGVPAAPVIRGAEAFDDPWLGENNFYETYDNGHLGDEVTGVRAFADWSRSKAYFAYPTPELAEHTIEVLREFGLPDERLLALLRARAIYTR